MKYNLTRFAKNLRNNSTEAEVRLWNYLKARQFENLKFRRQAPVGPYIVDFVCFSKKFIIELDGSQHLEKENFLKDKQRDAWLQSQGFRIFRIGNHEIMQNMEGVGEALFDKLIPLPCNPLPQGEGMG